MDRRNFLKKAAVAGVGVPIAMSLPGCAGGETETDTVTNTATITGPTVTNTVTNTATITGPTITLTGVSTAPIRVPEFAEVVDADEGTELMLASLEANGVKRIYFHGGTDTFHFMEAVAKFKAMGRPTPDIVMSTHEHTGLCAAMGEFHWTGKPQFWLAHVALGTMQPGGAWEEAWKVDAGIVAMAGRSGQLTNDELGPTVAYENPATRGSVQFRQEHYHQSSMLGCYAKWYYDIERVENVSVIINRAFQVAGSEPCGVSYLTYPMEVTSAPLDGGLLYDPVAFGPAIAPQGDSAALRDAARLLVEAENPLVIVGTMGRHTEAVASLVALAEKLALPVVETKRSMNFPPTHWANSSSRLSSRDVILIIDYAIPWTRTNPSATTKIISMNIDPIRSNFPLYDVPVHIPITCNSALALPVLNEMCDEFITSARSTAFAARKAELQAAKAESDATLAASLPDLSTQFPLSDRWVGECIKEVVDENTVLGHDLSRGLSSGLMPDRIQPGHYIPRMSANLGTPWGKGIGIKLAAPDKTVIVTGGDGCTIFAVPTAALQLQRQFNAPVLYCVHNNHQHRAVAGGLGGYGGADSYAAKAGYIGSAIMPSPDFHLIAQAMGAYGEKVTTGDQVKPALQRALDAVKGGQAAVLNFVTVGE